MFGFINIYKPKGKTSHDIVAILRRITKIKQIGHTGTLDPFAEGVLPVCIGKATRLIEYLKDDKAYIGTIQLGFATSTYDIEGEVTKTSDKKVSLDEVNKALDKFKGEIEQLPPIYSAIKVNGKKLYEYARKGEEVKIEPRKVTIEKLELLSFDKVNNTLEILIECSKGTYIRSIANDLGEELNTYGHLIKLVRIKAGAFKLNETIKLDELNTIDDVQNKLLNPLDYLDYDKYELSEQQLEDISHGKQLHNINTNDGTLVLTSNGNISAVGQVKNNIFKCSKVFI